jgi:hypothetical protein
MTVLPVVVTRKEFEDLAKETTGKLDCKHDWLWRSGLGLGQVGILDGDSLTLTHMCSGRVCWKCRRVEFLPLPHGVNAPTWEQCDLSDLRLRIIVPDGLDKMSCITLKQTVETQLAEEEQKPQSLLLWCSDNNH